MALGYGRTGTNNFSTAKFIVDINGIQNGATHTTIQGAIDDASSSDTIFVRPGTYTENLTMKAVNIVAFGGNGEAENVAIVGKVTMSVAGTCIFDGLSIETNSDNAILNSGSADTDMQFLNCYIIASDSTAISFTNSNASSSITIENSIIEIGTTGITAFVKTSPGVMNIDKSGISNPGGSSTVSTNSSGLASLIYCLSNIGISCSSSGQITCNYTFIDTSAQNVTCFETAGSGTSNILFSRFDSGTSPALTIGSGTTVNVHHLNVEVDSGDAIDGAGTIEYEAISFSGSSDNIATTTVNGREFRPGITLSQNQPSFSAYLAATQNNKTGTGTAYTLGTDALTEVFDQGGNFVTSGTFTAPYTGKYQLSAGVGLGNSTANQIVQLKIITSNRTYDTSVQRTATGLNNFVSLSVLADMDASDTYTVQVAGFGEAADTNSILGGSDYQTWMTGYLAH